MSQQQLNLAYANSNSTFFSEITNIRSIIKRAKNDEKMYVFTNEDETEISRGKSYAIFDELKEEAAVISTTAVRTCLNNRGVTHIAFQNKILSMLIQQKIAVHFGVANLILQVLIESLNTSLNADVQRDLSIQSLSIQNNENTIKLEIDDNDNGTLVVNFVYVAIINCKPERVIEACIKIKISLETVAITDCTLTKLSDSPTATAIYNAIEENQQNIFMKLLTFIMHLLGFNNELILEQREPDERGWEPSP